MTGDLVSWSDHLVISVKGLLENKSLFFVGCEPTENPIFSLFVCLFVCLFVYLGSDQIKNSVPIGEETRS